MHLCHTPSLTHIFVTLSFVTHTHTFVTHHVSHASLLHTIFATRPLSHTHTSLSHATLSHTTFHTHNFVTHHLSHASLSHTIFNSHLCHTQLCHTHTPLSHTMFHTHPCYTPCLPHALFHTHTHNFVTRNIITHHLSHTTLSHTTLSPLSFTRTHTTLHIQPFHSSILRHLLCLSFLPRLAGTFCFCLLDKNWLVRLSGLLIFWLKKKKQFIFPFLVFFWGLPTGLKHGARLHTPHLPDLPESWWAKLRPVWPVPSPKCRETRWPLTIWWF